MKEHIRYFKSPLKYNEPTGRHFNLPEHSISDFHCRVIYIVNRTPKRYDQKRIEKEESLIDQLNIRDPLGLNDHSGRHKFRT